MRLLLDENLSFRLLELLKSSYPSSTHVNSVGLEKASDERIWEYARKNNLAIVTKDADFMERTVLFGHPPKIIWITKGNCSTLEITELMKRNVSIVQTFFQNESLSVIALYK